MPRSAESSKAVEAAVRAAEEQGFIVHRKDTRIRVARADHPEIGTQIATNLGSGRALQNALASLRRLGVSIGDTGSHIVPSEGEVISLRGLQVPNKDWWDMTIEERAHFVWQYLDRQARASGMKARIMHGVDYYFYDGPLSDAFHLLFPDMPYEPRDGDNGVLGARGVYRYLKDNKIVISQKIGNRMMQAVRSEWSKVIVTQAKTKARKAAESEEPVDQPVVDIEDDGHLLAFLDPAAKCMSCGHTANMHGRGLNPCKAKNCIGGPNRQPCPVFANDPDLTCPICLTDDTLQVTATRQGLKEHMLRGHGNLTHHPSLSRDRLAALLGEETVALLEATEGRMAHANVAAATAAHQAAVEQAPVNTTVETVVETEVHTEVEIVGSDAMSDIDVALGLLREQIEKALVANTPIGSGDGDGDAARLLEEVKQAYRDMPPMAAYQTVLALLNP